MRFGKKIVDEDKRPVVPPSGPADYVALVWATGLFTGYAPVAPGTFGSALAAVAYYAAVRLGLFSPFDHGVILPFLVVCTAVSYTGIWASERAVGFFGHKDPNEVVVDEVAGQLITYAFLPLVPRAAEIPWGIEAWTLIGFLLFRVLDIVKVYPGRKLEKLDGGLGIMADDVLSGIQGAILMLLAGVVASRFLT